MKRWFRFTLRPKIILASILCLILPGFLTMIITGYTTQSVLTEQEIRNEKKSLELTDNYISTLLRTMIYISNYIQFDTDLTRILKKTSEGKADSSEEVMDQAKVTEKLDNLTYHSERTFVTILSPNGKYFTNYSVIDHQPALFFEESWFDQLKQMRAFDILWLGSHPSYFSSGISKHPNMITIARTLKTPSGKTYAYVLVSIYENQINRSLAYDETGHETMLIHADGRIISHRDRGRIGQVFSYAGHSSADKDSSMVTIAGKDYLLLVHPLSISDWKLVYLAPYKQVTAKIDSIYRTNIIVQILWFGIFLFILIYVIRQFTNPIVKLDKVVAMVEGGDLSVRSNIRGRDEIGKLGASFDKMIDQVVHMIDRITYEQTMKRKAELEMLQAQINPHFLFNVLNSIRLRIMLRGDQDSANIIYSLSSLLRMTINRNNEFITLHDEINMVKHYIELLNFRHKESIKMEVDAAMDSLSVFVPRFFIQPLIENAHIHGYSQRGGTVIIRSWLGEEGILYVVVEDRGLGMSESKIKSLEQSFKTAGPPEERKQAEQCSLSGIGLRNIYTRLKLIYGERFDMRMESEIAQGTRITFLIPTQAGDEHV